MAAAGKKHLGDFKSWQVNLDLYCLQDEEGNELFAQPRLLKLLSALQKNPNRVIRRNEIIEQVWEDVVVGEESLSKAAFDLRKFLQDNFKNPPAIVTIRKVGYKLVPFPVEEKKPFKQKAFKVLKTVAYAVLIVVLAILVIRGLNY